jgi:hypothetical protein
MSPEALTPDPIKVIEDAARTLAFLRSAVASGETIGHDADLAALQVTGRLRDLGREMDAVRQEAADTSGLRSVDALLEEAVGILAKRGGYGWTDALAVVQRARAAIAAGATERPLDVERLADAIGDSMDEWFEGDADSWAFLSGEAEDWMHHMAATILARLSPATATPEATERA